MINPSNQKSIGKSPQDRVDSASNQTYANSQPYNTFDLSHSVPDTQRAADQIPFEFVDCVSGDRFIISSSSKIKANQLPAPLMSAFSAYEDYYSVPMSCMYPVNYDKIIANPTKGDDVPLAALPSFPIAQYIARLCFTTPLNVQPSNLFAMVGSSSFTLSSDTFADSDLIDNVSGSLSLSSIFQLSIRFNYFLRVLFLLSSDSLLHRIGYGVDYRYTLDVGDFDLDIFSDAGYSLGDTLTLQEVIKVAFDYMYNVFTEHILTPVESDEGPVYGSVRFVKPINATSSFTNFSTSVFGSWQFSQYCDVRTLSELRDIMYGCVENGYLFSFSFSSDSLDPTVFYNNLSLIFSILRQFSVKLNSLSNYDASAVELPPVAYINPSRLIAYHLAMAQYSSVDTVDYLFTAKLWMQNMESLLFNPITVFGQDFAQSPAESRPTFYYNGVSTVYDLFTIGSFQPALNSVPFNVIKILGLFSNLFVPSRSLRYRDYFMSARPNVTAVGNLQIAMNNNVLFASDVTKGLVTQRYLNAVNRVGNKLVDYLAGIFGVVPRNVEAEPHFIARRKINITSIDNTNVSDNLGAQQSNLVSDDSLSGVDVYIDEDSVIVGVRSFDILGANVSGISRHLMNFDRFQKFNPMFQNIGDQDIKLIELTGDLSDASSVLPVFGYAGRYAEYKEPVSLAHGGSILYTPGWFFLRKFFQPTSFSTLDNPSFLDKTIKPSLIRHSNAEFDSIMSGNTSLDPAGYFHFIVSQTNSITAVRKMNYFTSILWN